MKPGIDKIDQMTPIAGPSHQQLRAPFQKTMAQIRAEQQVQQKLAEARFREDTKCRTTPK